MTIEVNVAQVRKVVSKIRSKLIDIILELEKNFDNLDELDIRPQLETQDTNHQKIVIQNIEKIIYGDSTEIGDGNKIKKSSIGKFLKRGFE